MEKRLRISHLNGGCEINKFFHDLASVRIEVFREFPYLYEGSIDYEKEYLDTYLKSERAYAVLLWDEERCVGATTAIPLVEADLDIQKPFRDHGYDIHNIDYFGESIILHEYRGLGFGRQFFAYREAHACRNGLSECVFCAVERDPADSRAPNGYQPNDVFWVRRGYKKDPSLTTFFEWRDRGESDPTEKLMIFWKKSLKV